MNGKGSYPRVDPDGSALRNWNERAPTLDWNNDPPKCLEHAAHPSDVARHRGKACQQCGAPIV